METCNHTTIDIRRERCKFLTIFPKWKACNIMHEYDKNGLVLSWAATCSGGKAIESKSIFWHGRQILDYRAPLIDEIYH